MDGLNKNKMTNEMKRVQKKPPHAHHDKPALNFKMDFIAAGQ